MKENIKNFNYYNFNFKIEPECVTKNELSVEKFYNLCVQGEKIEPVQGFCNLLEEILGEELFDDFSEENPQLVNNIVSVSSYSYFDELNSIFKTIYFLITSGKKLYKLEVLTDYVLTDLAVTFSCLPQIFSFNGKLYFYSAGDKFLYFEKTTGIISISNFIELKTILNFQDKTFFSVSEKPYRLYYSNDIEIENISDDLSNYDYIDLLPENGKILKLISLKNNLYVVCQFGISKIIFSNSANYSTQNCTINSVVRENTIEQINDYIIFFTRAGLYLFDGNEIKRIFENFTKSLLIYDEIKSIIFDNKYYVLSKYVIDGAEKSVLCEFDLHSMTSKIFYTGNANNFFCLKNESDYKLVVARCETVLNPTEINYYYLDSINSGSAISGKKYVKFNRICFDDNVLKTITEIKTISSGNYTLKIKSENNEKTFDISGCLNVSSIGLSGYSFDIEIYSNSNFELKAISFLVQNI